MTTITRTTEPHNANDLLSLCDVMPRGFAALERALARRGLLPRERRQQLAIARAALEMALDFLPNSQDGDTTEDAQLATAISASKPRRQHAH